MHLGDALDELDDMKEVMRGKYPFAYRLAGYDITLSFSGYIIEYWRDSFPEVDKIVEYIEANFHLRAWRGTNHAEHLTALLKVDGESVFVGEWIKLPKGYVIYADRILRKKYRRLNPIWNALKPLPDLLAREIIAVFFLFERLFCNINESYQ
jgi:hypothetical protein